MPPVTVMIICKDEQLHIADCIASARLIADEILVADSGSTDATLRIVRELGNCRLIEREFISYADFKNWALPQCRHEWVLILDADERITPELAGEVKTLLAREPQQDAYSIRRDNYFLGHRIRFSGWNNDRVVRLVRRSACRYVLRPVHESMQVAPGKTGALRHAMLHFTCWNVEQFIIKQNKYSTLAAEALHEQGKRTSLVFALLHAPIRFWQNYLLRGGFLDGYPGFMICGITAFYTFLKDIKLWELQHTLNPPPGLRCSPEREITLPQRRAA